VGRPSRNRRAHASTGGRSQQVPASDRAPSSIMQAAASCRQQQQQRRTINEK